MRNFQMLSSTPNTQINEQIYASSTKILRGAQINTLHKTTFKLDQERLFTRVVKSISSYLVVSVSNPGYVTSSCLCGLVSHLCGLSSCICGLPSHLSGLLSHAYVGSLLVLAPLARATKKKILQTRSRATTVI